MSHLHLEPDEAAAFRAFPGPDNQLSYTCTHVLDEALPILRVSHDEDDGAWQFVCGGVHEDAAEGRVVCLECMVARDPSLRELADLPPGWGADRDSVDTPWERSANSPSPEA